MFQHPAGGIQLPRMGGDLSRLEDGVYEIKLATNIEHLAYSCSSAFQLTLWPSHSHVIGPRRNCESAQGPK